MDEGRPRERINFLTAIFMGGVAFGLDSLQALLELIPAAGIFLGWAVSMFGFIAFWIWFMLCDVEYLGKNGVQKIATSLGAFVTEFIPYVSMMPALTLAVLSIVHLTMKEDGEARMRAKDTASGRPMGPANDNGEQGAAMQRQQQEENAAEEEDYMAAQEAAAATEAEETEAANDNEEAKAEEEDARRKRKAELGY